jgi:hypothetical protein
VIDSDIALPELSRAPGGRDAEWRIRCAPAGLMGDLGTSVGAEPVYDGVQVRSFAAGAVRTLVFDDTGTFEIRPSDRHITWFRGSSATEPAVRADVLGRVMAFAAHADGCLPLHASAVSIGGRAVAFLGPKHAGKSTLAMALVRCGAQLITDDTLVVRLAAGLGARAAPGVQQIRLWNDSARALDAETHSTAGGKPAVGSLTPIEMAVDEVPLVACYVLEAGETGTLALVRRRRLSPPEAAIACVRFSKLGALAGGLDAATVLDRAAALTRLVPVLTATVRRDLASVQQLAARFVAWHADRDVAVP